MSALPITAVAPHASIHDMSDCVWEPTAKPGLWLKTVRSDQRLGTFLGLVRFDAFVRSGLHQHQGVATSFVIDGGLTDHHGAIRLHEAGINLKGATHDAIAYQPTVLVSRLEGPVSYPSKDPISGVHTGSYAADDVRNLRPEVPPEINVSVDAVPRFATRIGGIERQTLFDYADTGSAHRMVQLVLKPGASLTLQAQGLTEFWVRGGAIDVDGEPACANTFVTCPAGCTVTLKSPFGALLIAWAEQPERGDSNLFGF